MGRTALVPPELMAGPFTLSDALRVGLDRWHLEGKSWRRMGPNIYVWAGLPDSPELKLKAALRRLPAAAVFSGLTAAWLHGLDVEACEPIEVTIPKGIGVWARSGLMVRRASHAPHEVVNIRGMRASSILRTLSDVSIRLSVTEAVVVVDMALHAGLTRLAHLHALCVARAGPAAAPRSLDRCVWAPSRLGWGGHSAPRRELRGARHRVADGIAVANGARVGWAASPSGPGINLRKRRSNCRAP